MDNKRFGLSTRMHPDSPAYNMAWAVEWQGKLDRAVLRRALQAIVNRHPVLRTTIDRVDDGLAQTVKPIGSYQWNEQLASDWPEQQLMQTLKVAYEKPFDLTQEGALRADLLQIAPQHYIFLLTLHHIFGDARSIDLLGKELLALYHAELAGQQSVLAPMPSSYADFVRAETSLLNSDAGEGLLNYWRRQLGNGAPVLNLPTDCPRPNTQSFTGDSVPFCCSTEITQQLKQLAAHEKASLFTLLLTVFQVFLHRYTGQNEIWIGTPTSVSTRQPQFANLVGYLVNPVVLKAEIDPTASFSELLALSNQTVWEAIEHSAYPFSLLVKELQPQRDLSHSPLFQVMLDFQTDFPAIEQANAQLKVSPLELAQMEGQFDLTLTLCEAEQLSGRLSYSLDLFKRETIERMVKHFEVLLRAFVDDPKQAIGTVPMLTEAEVQQLHAWNDTTTDYPQDQTLVGLFEAQVESTPDNIAVVFEGESLTYRQLNTQANQLAHHLLSLAKPDGQPLLSGNPLIAIAVERSLDMIIGLLAILKAGGAYVPVDPSYPPSRIRYMLEDSQAPLLLTQSHLTEALALDGLGHECVVLCLDQTDVAGQPSENLPARSIPEDLAYVIYTSGSTGKPKGVMIKINGLVNLALAQIKAFEMDASSRILQFASFSFDASVSEISTAFLVGASLTLITKETLLGADQFGALLVEQQISHATFPPSFLNNLSEQAFSGLKTLVVAGETCAVEVMKRWSQKLRFINAYGPTENTVCASVAVCNPGMDTVSIGQPIANTRVYILNAQHQPQPPGIPGELCIAGAGLARGYLNRPELTAEKFIEVELFGKTERIYKTGDLARWLADGNLEYLGRIDHQVKLRGFRIELGEIEAVLTQHEGVKEAVVSLYEADGNKRLVAHLVVSDQWPESGDPCSMASGQKQGLDIHATFSRVTGHGQLTAALTAFLKSRLPDYMIPASFMVLDSLPLTPNGKLDRLRLPAPDNNTRSESALPRDTVELQLVSLWETVLNVPSVGIHDDFFSLGGHSLLAVKLMNHIREQFTARLPISALFQHTTVASLAELLRQEGTRRFTDLAPIHSKGTTNPVYCLPGIFGSVMYLYPLATSLGAQQRFYALQTPGLDGSATLDTIDELACHHLKLMQQQQASGPYQLVGHSSGGRVAFDMAWQLEQQGETVYLLAIMDAHAPGFRSFNSSELECLVAYVQMYEQIMGNSLNLSSETIKTLPDIETAYAAVAHTFLQHKLLFDPKAAVDELKAMVNVVRITGQALADHPMPGKLRCPIHLFRASEQSADDEMNDTREAWGWAQYTHAAVTEHWVPGNHLSMMFNSHVKTLAEKLSRYLSDKPV